MNEVLNTLSQASKAAIQSNSFEKTNWIVISGPPFSGKSTIVIALERMGFQTVNDQARLAISSLIRQGKTKFSARTDYQKLQDDILQRMLIAANEKSTNDLVFWDYSFPDNLAYLKVSNLPWTSNHVNSSTSYRFRAIFLCEPLDATYDSSKDRVRTEDGSTHNLIFETMKGIYEALGYQPIILPRTSPEERVKFIMKKVKSLR